MSQPVSFTGNFTENFNSMGAAGSFGRFVLAPAVLALWCATPAMSQPVSFTGNFTENFNSMGAAGTAPPTGWQLFTIAGDSATWTNSTGSNNTVPIGAIPNGAAVAGGTASTGLTVNDSPTGNQSNGYNALGASGAAGDRAIVTAPTGIAGNALQLQLVNNSGAARTSLQVAYTLRAYQAGGDSARTPPPGIPEGAEELPGYWLFYSLDNGATFTAVNSLIPVGQGPSSNPVVPNQVGNFTIPTTSFTFAAAQSWAPGSNLFLRWIDDNAIDPSPDQIFGLDNVTLSIAPVPEPSSLLCVSAVGLLAGGRFIRKRFRRAA